MKLRSIFVLSSAFAFSLALLGCEGSEVRDIAKAQECMDAVTTSSQAAACFTYVEKYTSQQANILKCSIKLTMGGLTTDQMVQAYKISDDNNVAASDKQVAYLGALTLSSYSLAQEAYGYCVLSEVSGLKFIGGLAKIASLVGASYDPANPSGSITAIEAALGNCASGGSCTAAEMDEAGSVVADISETYCATPSSDEEVCADINQAIADAGGDATLAAKQFMCQLQEKTYNGTTCI